MKLRLFLILWIAGALLPFGLGPVVSDHEPVDQGVVAEQTQTASGHVIGTPDGDS